MKRVILIFGIFSFAFSGSLELYKKKVDPKLLEKLEKMKENEEIKIYIQLEEVDFNYVFSLSTSKERKEYMKNHAFESQKPIVEYLKNRLGNVKELYQGWTANRIFAKLPKWIIEELLQNFPQILKIYEDEYKIWIPQDYTPHILSEFFPGEDYISGSVLNVKADEAWRRGYSGKGIVVGNMDTGVDFNHPALKNSFRGISAWYDAVGGQATPYDDNGHGTGTMGFIAGSHGIGIAPRVKWIAVKILDANGGGTTSGIQAGFDWVANLPDSLRPHIMSNSWGSNNTTATTFWPNVQSWLAVGIIPVFAIGNAGPNGGTAGTPGNFPMVFGIGGTWWPSEEIMGYSSRGPAPDQTPWNQTAWWPRPDWQRHKPDFIAPSEPTVTAAPDGNYQSFNGTSAATPHAAGVIALLLQANNFGIVPSMANADTSEIRDLYQFMSGYNMGNMNSYWNPEWGNPFTNPSLRDTFGWGRVDAEKYISNVPEPSLPHIFIDSVWVVSTNDGDKNIEPGENRIYIGIRLKNTGSNATNVNAKIVYSSNTNLTISSGGPFSYGNLLRGQSASVTSFILSASSTLPQTTRIYFTLRITADGYKKHDFFYLDTYKAEEGTQTIVLKNDNGSAYWYPGNDPEYNNYIYFASRFELPKNGTMLACSIYCYNPGTSAVQETLFVWQHNSTYNSPGNLIAYRTISVSAGNGWKYFDIQDIPGLQAGYIWVGVNKANASGYGVPYQDNNGASTTNKSTNTRNNPSSWVLESYWYDFMIRPVIQTDPLTYPSIFYEGSYLIDDSRYGNGNGWLDPGEMAGLSISLKNLGLFAYDVVCTLKTADAYTANTIQILDNIANFGDVPYGNPSANNYNDPWIIRVSDTLAMHGQQDFNFIVKVVGKYYNSSGGPFTYTTNLNITVSSPFIPYENHVWYIPEGTGGLYYTTSVSSRNRYNYSDFYFGLTPYDSFYVDTLYGFYYNTDQTPDNDDIVRLYIHNHCATNPNLPGTQIWTYNFGANQAAGWKKRVVNLKVPGWIWNGIYTGGSALDGVYPVFFGSPFVGYYIFIYSAQPTGCNPPDVASGGGIPYAFYVVSHHFHPALSYYRPENWSWPITPTNTNGGTNIPSTLSGYDWSTKKDTTWVAFAILNRSSVNIPAPPNPIARDVWDNYIFLDNWSRWDVTYSNALPAWNYIYAANGLYILVPGGRHTLFLGIDWNTEVRGNIFNEYLRYWGMQFSWKAPKLYARDAPKRVKWVPDLTGPGAGPYYNCTAYACSLYTSPTIPGYGKPWHAVAIRNFNIGNAGDSIDLDLRLYSDKPEDPYSGYTDVLEASELGPGEVDYIMVDGHHLGTTYYAGVYSFLSPQNRPPDTAWIQWEMARKVITTSDRWNYLDDSFKDSTIVHVYDIIINNGQTFRCSLITLSGFQDFGIALYGSKREDRIKRRIDYLAMSDVIAPGKEYISYTNTGANDTFGLVIYGNLNQSGNYRLKFTGTSQPLGIMEIEFSGISTPEGILLKWGDIKDAIKLYVERENKKGYERIAEIPPDKNEYLDRNVENGKTYTYKLVIEMEKDEKVLGPITVIYFNPLPKVLTVLGINPLITRNNSILKISVPKKEKVEIILYDATGRIEERVFSGYLERGIYEFNLKKKTKGVYFIIVRDKERSIRKKIVFM